MKRLFLFTCLSALSLTFTGCSDDDSAATNEPGGTITMTFDGVQKTYNTFSVTETPFEGWQLVEITASQDGAADEVVHLEIEKNATGVDALYNIDFVVDGQAYDFVDLNTNITHNSNNHVKGTFSGTFTHFVNVAEPETHTVSNGSFDINY